LRTILLEDLHDAVDESTELTVTTGTNISSKTGSGEIKRVHDSERSGTSGTTGSAVTDEELNGFFLGIVWVEYLLVIVLESEVKGLCGEITDDVSQVTSPERSKTLLLDDSLEAVDDTVISVLYLDGGRSVLHLQKELDSLNRGDNSLRYSS